METAMDKVEPVKAWAVISNKRNTIDALGLYASQDDAEYEASRYNSRPTVPDESYRVQRVLITPIEE